MTTNINLQADQLFWCMGALERLQGLGVLGDVKYYICPTEIERWQSVDERRHEILGNDALLSSILFHLCRDSGMTDRKEIELVIRLVTDFRDKRTKLVSELLGNVINS